MSLALVFANLSTGIGTAKERVGISAIGILMPEIIMKSIISVVMAGIRGIYGVIVSVILI